MSKVFFLDYSQEREILSGIETLFRELGLEHIMPKGGSVAVKLHMGELGNITYLRPVFVRKVINIIKEIGGKPFATDTTVIYPGGRYTEQKYLETAAFNGFTEEGLGAPILIADGNGYEGVSVPLDNIVEGCGLGEVKVASKIYHADFLLVLSHVKGHAISGFGGAMKNLGMGCVTKESKRAQHAAISPVFDESRCDGCGICVEECPTHALTLEQGKLRRNLETCTYCSTCLFKCPASAWFWKEGAKEEFQVYLAHAASGVLQGFKGRVGFVNFVQDVTPYCDCATPSGKPLVSDVGILASLDPVAIDQASLDLIDQAHPLLTSAPLEPPDILGEDASYR